MNWKDIVKPKTADDKVVYGPVPSRRLGRSLGVDLVPHKVCSYDCIYCQLGRTVEKTAEHRPHVSVDTVRRQVRERLLEGPSADYVTLGGSGEPTLNSNIGSIITALKTETDLPVAVLTNSSLLWDADIRDALLRADVVLPSLDAGTSSIAPDGRPAHGQQGAGHDLRSRLRSEMEARRQSRK